MTTARDGAPIDFDHDDLWSRERYQSMVAPFFVCQKWMQLAAQGKWLDRCTLVATTAEEGDFGLKRGAEAAQGGALAGLLKGIFVEFTIMQNERNLRIKVVDAPADAPADELAADIFRELASGRLDYEVAFAGGRRFIPCAVERELNAAVGAEIQPGATWIVTGGARGITTACALELGRRYGLKLHLIGSTPLTSIDDAWRDLDEEGLKQLKVSVMIAARKAGRNAAQAWERTKKDIEIDSSMRAFADAGVAATYHACDVSNRAKLARTLDAIRQIDGPIAGILHGAGLERSCRFEKKQRDIVLQTIDIKVGGAANLMALTKRDPIRHFIGFGSISGRLGGFGQTDYSLANEMLAKLLGAYRRQRPWIKAVTFHWHAWGEIGMAARPELKGILEGEGSLSFLPPQEGIAHLMRELAGGSPEPEVLITEPPSLGEVLGGLNELNPTESGGSESGSGLAGQHKTAGAQVAAPPPLLTNIRSEGQVWVADLPLNPTRDPFLVEHLLRNRPLLPVVVGLEALAEIAKAAGGQRVVGFRNVDMMDGLLFHTDRAVVARVRAPPRADGSFDCELTCDFRNRAGGLIKADRPYLRTTVELAAGPLALSSPLPPMPDQPIFRDIVYPDDAPVYHGGPFRGVTSAYCYDTAAGWARDHRAPARRPDRTRPRRRLDGAVGRTGLGFVRLRAALVGTGRQRHCAAAQHRAIAVGPCAAGRRAMRAVLHLPQPGDGESLLRLRTGRRGRSHPAASARVSQSLRRTRRRLMRMRDIVLTNYARIGDFDAPRNFDSLGWLNLAERIELDRLSHELRRRQWLIGRWLAKQLIQRAAGAELSDIRILARDERGRGVRPQLRVAGQMLPWSVSISHSDRAVLVALAASDAQMVGVDLADLRPARVPRSDAGFRRLWFTADEQAAGWKSSRCAVLQRSGAPERGRL